MNTNTLRDFHICMSLPLKKILSKNASKVRQKFIDKCIQKFLKNMFIQRPQIPTVPKKELRIILPYLGKMS